MSLDLSGEITAIATAVLAAFAIVTGIYAVRAFRKQSQEVRDQASMLQIQSEQLAEQRKVNEEQIRVLALQAAELRESLDERKHEAVERRNAQAAQVRIVLKVVARGREGGPEIEATAVNTSERQQPVYDVKLYWHLGQQGYGSPNPELLGTLLTSRDESRRREFPRGADPAACGAALSFRDAFGVNWVKTPDGGAMHAESDLLPDLAKALSGTSRNGDSPLAIGVRGGFPSSVGSRLVPRGAGRIELRSRVGFGRNALSSWHSLDRLVDVRCPRSRGRKFCRWRCMWLCVTTTGTGTGTSLPRPSSLPNIRSSPGGPPKRG